MAKVILFAVVALFLISMINAEVLCNRNYIDNENPTVICNNQNNISVSINRFGSMFTLDKSELPADTSTSITASFSSNAIVGNLGLITFSNSSTQISVNNNQAPINTCQLNPTIVFYSQAVQVGTKMDLPLITFSPENCQGTFSINTAYITGGITTSSGQKPVYIKSANSNSIQLSIDTTDLSSQETYTSELTISAFGKSYKVSTFQIIVTSGTGAVTNFSSSNLPICSLTATRLATNSSYNLICSNIQPNIKVVPRIDTDIIQGVNVDTTNTQFVYTFKPVKLGETTIYADFLYHDSPIGQPFSQKVLVASSGFSGGSTNLKFIFNPSLDKAKSGESVLIQLVDNSTNSLVNLPEIYIDLIPISSLNNSGNTFSHSFLIDKTYEIRGKAIGYNDLVQKISLTSRPLNITITPSSGDSQTMFKIEPIDLNASLFIDNVKVSNNSYYGTLSAGVHNIKAIGEGFFDYDYNFTVDLSLTASSTEFKKGVNSIITLSKNCSWEVVYKKDINSIEESKLTGSGASINFKPDRNGIYLIKSNGVVLATYELKGWDYKLFGYNILYYIAGLIILFAIFLILRKRGGSSYDGTVNM